MVVLIRSLEMRTLVIVACLLFMFLFELGSMFMRRKDTATLPPMPVGWLSVVCHVLRETISRWPEESISRWHEEYGPVLMLQPG
ncbi:hypothetical protein EJ110_NYTH21652 [Nymphaea thermarum]|nr:hypothetical protein EJ110_NYTH21652 [Nymphaea thermarum]